MSILTWVTLCSSSPWSTLLHFENLPKSFFLHFLRFAFTLFGLCFSLSISFEIEGAKLLGGVEIVGTRLTGALVVGSLGVNGWVGGSVVAGRIEAAFGPAFLLLVLEMVGVSGWVGRSITGLIWAVFGRHTAIFPRWLSSISALCGGDFQ